MPHDDVTPNEVEKKIEAASAPSAGEALTEAELEEVLKPFRNDPELYAYIKENPARSRFFLTDLTGISLISPSE